jgi:hypothetical protein
MPATSRPGIVRPDSILTSSQADTRSSKLKPTPAVERVVAFDLVRRPPCLCRLSCFLVPTRTVPPNGIPPCSIANGAEMPRATQINVIVLRELTIFCFWSRCGFGETGARTAFFIHALCRQCRHRRSKIIYGPSWPLLHFAFRRNPAVFRLDVVRWPNRIAASVFAAFFCVHGPCPAVLHLAMICQHPLHGSITWARSSGEGCHG